jgi:hypothetical protein
MNTLTLARRRTVGVPMLARPRREVVELHIARARALSEAAIWAVDIGLAVTLATFTGIAALRWWGF